MDYIINEEKLISILKVSKNVLLIEPPYIRKYIPEFEIDYKIDPVKQALADSWPNNLEDYAARVEWDWKPLFDLDKMTEDMLKVLSDRKNRNSKGQL